MSLNTNTFRDQCSRCELITMLTMWGSGVTWAVLRRPRLWGEAVRTVGAMTTRGWWKSKPFLPRPDPAYMAWRMATAYGSESAKATAKDIVDYLEWRRRFRASTRNGAAIG